MKKLDKKAFTLIELIVVIAVIGILVLLGIPRFIGHTQKAELARIQHDVRVMEQEVGAMLITNDDDFNKWENNNKDFNQLIKESKLFDKEGPVKKVESADKTYKIIPEEFAKKTSTKLKGTFYLNDDGKVYYEHVKPLFEDPTGPKIPNPEESGEPGESDGSGGSGESDGSGGKDLVCSYNKEGLMNPIEPREPIKGETAIASADELAKIGKEYPLNGKYILTSDIKLSGGAGWAPIGNNSSKFTGSFNGNGYKITGLTINRPTENYVGLFGYTEGAIISNVALEDINVTGNSRVGGLVGLASNSTTISNSYTTGSVTGKGEYVGGLVGEANKSTIENSYSTAKVTSQYIGGGPVGGLVGAANQGNKISNSCATGEVTGAGGAGGLVGSTTVSTIENSYATGTVRGKKLKSGWLSENVGGFVGRFGSGTISESYATGKVYGENSVGGFVGFTNYDAITRKSYATGEVTGKDKAGGFVGKALGGTYENSYATGSVTGGIGGNGGFVGWTDQRTTISNSYSTGSVTAEKPIQGISVGGKVGGFVGHVEGLDFPIRNSYWDTEITEQEKSTGYYQGSSSSSSRYQDYLDGVKGKSTNDMKSKETYEGWDFEKVWKIDEGNDYPKLR